MMLGNGSAVEQDPASWILTDARNPLGWQDAQATDYWKRTSLDFDALWIFPHGGLFLPVVRQILPDVVWETY